MRKGIRDEREIIHRLDKLGFAVIRSPSSGAGTKLDRPDIIAGRKGLYLAIEVKSTRKEELYINRKSVEQLVRFSDKFGATPVIAVKFVHRGWFLFEPQNLDRKNKSFKISIRDAKRRGKTLESIVTRRLANFSTES